MTRLNKPITARPRGGQLPSLFCIAIIVGCLLSSHSAYGADKELGAYLASQCTTCHRNSAKARTIPPIFGWDPAAFVAVMNSYKNKQRPNKVMQTIASGLSKTDIEALAAHFATIKPN